MLKCLIVEDNEKNYVLLKKMLHAYGRADIATNGETAVKAFVRAHQNKEPYSAIFLDIMMPGIDGHKVLMKIRDWEKKHLGGLDPVRVVMATSLKDTKTVVKSYDEGCHHFFPKPYDKTELDDLMAEMGFPPIPKQH